MNIDNLTIGQIRELNSMFSGGRPASSAYVLGMDYQFRTVTHIITGKLVEIHPDGLVVTDAAWVADTGRYADAVASGEYREVEPYPDDARVIVNWSAMIDAVQIPVLPREQK